MPLDSDVIIHHHDLQVLEVHPSFIYEILLPASCTITVTDERIDIPSGVVVLEMDGVVRFGYQVDGVGVGWDGMYGVWCGVRCSMV